MDSKVEHDVMRHAVLETCILHCSVQGVGGNKFKQHNYSGGGKTEDKLELRQPPKKKEMRRLNAKKKNKTCPS